MEQLVRELVDKGALQRGRGCAAVGEGMVGRARYVRRRGSEFIGTNRN